LKEKAGVFGLHLPHGRDESTQKSSSPFQVRHLAPDLQLHSAVPPFLVPQIARTPGAEDKARSFTPWSHVVSLLYGQLSHSSRRQIVCSIG
jgi:hypothetical protein